MGKSKSRRKLVIAILLLLLLLLALLLSRCRSPVPATSETAATASPAPVVAESAPTAAPAPEAPEPDDVLTPATLEAPAEVGAGAVFTVAWTGPNNARDYLTIVRRDAADGTYANYSDVRGGNPLRLTAPIDPGEWELRYMTARARAVLGRAPVTVVAAEATLDAVAEITLDTAFSVSWTGPDNAGDYITIVTRDTPDGRYGNYTTTKQGSPLQVTALTEAGEAELRYMTGQGARVLTRRPIRIVMPEVTLSAPAEAIAGSAVAVTWTGPANPADYITVVTRDTRDGQYGNYATVNNGSPLNVTMLMSPGEAELRYMTGRNARVLARRPIRIVAAEVSLSAPATAAAGTPVSITWTGPANPGDYITIVARGVPDNKYGNYATVNRGSPLTVAAPKESGEAEIRYVSGQGTHVLARRTIVITP